MQTFAFSVGVGLGAFSVGAGLGADICIQCGGGTGCIQCGGGAGCRHLHQCGGGAGCRHLLHIQPMWKCHSGPVVLKWVWCKLVAVGPGGSGVRVAKA